ncbi:MAG: Uma2 family endonuclease [Aridibacter sp.]
MSKALAAKEWTEDEYLKFEENAKNRHEFMDGEIISMAGGTRKHSLLTTNISRLLGNHLEKTDCEVYSSDFKVKVREGHNVYPDVAVACGEIITSNNDLILHNPLIVFEILSKSTEKRDRGEKAEDYFRMESLTDYILVSQTRVRVEHFSRQTNNEWTLKIYETLDDNLELDSIKCRIPLDLIYLKLKLPTLNLVNKKKKNK